MAGGTAEEAAGDTLSTDEHRARERKRDDFRGLRDKSAPEEAVKQVNLG